MFCGNYFRGKLKSATKWVSEALDSLTRALFIFDRVVAPKGWAEGVDKKRIQRIANPSLMTYLSAFLILIAAFLMMLPYSLFTDSSMTEVVTAALGFISVVSLSSILLPLGVVFSFLLGLRITKFLKWRIDFKATAVHLSNCVGIAGVVGFLSVAMAPLVVGMRISVNEFSSSVLFDGSVLLKFPAAFGVVGLLLGLCTTSCHIVSGVDNIIYRNVVPVIFFNILVVFFAFELNLDPFSICLSLSKEYLRANPGLVMQADSVSSVEAENFMQVHLPVVVARVFSQSGDSSFAARVWYVVVVVALSLIGMFWTVCKEFRVRYSSEFISSDSFAVGERGWEDSSVECDGGSCVENDMSDGIRSS